MSARKELDQKNMKLINNKIKSYPNLVAKYINSMSSKTSYTKLYYCNYVCNFLDYMNNEMNINIFDYSLYNNIKPMDIDSYMEHVRFLNNGKEKSGISRAAYLAAIKNFFTFLRRNGVVDTNPCENIEIPKDKNEHEITTISDKDMDIIMYNIDHGVGSPEAIAEQKKWRTRDKAIILLGVTTGLRMGAIIGIDIDDINLENKTITVVEKGDRKRIIYIGDKTANAIENWLCDRDLMVNSNVEKAVFISRNKTRMSPDTMQSIVKRVTTGIDKNITPHKMRATCATRLYEQTGDIYLVQQQLGHKSIKNTERYAKVSNERKIQAANILDSIF